MYVFPVHRFNPQTVAAAPRALTLTGGTTISGDEDFIATDGGGRWFIEFGGIHLNTPEKERAWSAWMAYLDEGVQPCLVPLVTMRTAPRPSTHKQFMRPPPLVDNDTWFSETVDVSTPYIEATSGAAALRATSLEIDIVKGADLVGGETFSVGQRAYRVLRPTGAGLFEIRPPVRAALAAGTPLNFNWPVVKCRVEPGNAPPSVFASKSAEVGIRFVEYTR